MNYICKITLNNNNIHLKNNYLKIKQFYPKYEIQRIFRRSVILINLKIINPKKLN